MALIPYDGWRNSLLDLVDDHVMESVKDCLCWTDPADSKWQSGAAMQAYPLPTSQPWVGRRS